MTTTTGITARRRNLTPILDDLPSVHEGCRGVSAELAELRHYMAQHGLCWADNSDLTDHIVRRIGGRYRATSYLPGGRKRPAYYGHGYVTGAAELAGAHEAAEALGLRAKHGLIFRIPEPGIRDSYAFSASSHRWVFVRRWRKVRGEDLLVTGVATRIGRYSIQRARRGEDWLWRVIEYAGPLAAKRTRKIKRIRTVAWRRVTDLPAKVIHSAVGPIYSTNRGRGLAPGSVRVTARLLRRICPADWEVVITPPSQGASPCPAFRERATGEEYHFAHTIRHRHPVREAREAFDRRASQRDHAEIAALVERGEAADIYVCAADSYRAGNCRAGTSSFASRHDLDIARHYRAGEIASIANGDAQFVRAAIIAAVRRNRREIARGYCDVAEHQGLEG